ncbi:ABC transporter ATP-binding protein, partial [Actinomadura sp. KC216]
VGAVPGGVLMVTGLDVAAIGDAAAAQGIPLYEVRSQSASLEEAYMELTTGRTDFGVVAS